MYKSRLKRAAPLALFLGWACGQAGCCQPCCPQGAATVTAQPGVVRYGSVCEVPSTNSAVASQAGAQPPTMASAPRPKVVVSEPSGRLPGSAGWRRTNPESIATRNGVDGALDDDVSIRR